ncbi:MAG TPA: L-seryl-tRNA(Sec) selenium transferase [Dehalococcoidia bacterium]|jgi:L-seryl-tRNA(Ser) seleniumtransferase|nr:L-seryl-tRNA(Sec) selenium transferase [Dehalococcoidia bacterium]HIK88629.1 L-seryl-tRNA(Sec) selenium transferase [Dehalococcoidia bacterium]
MTESAYRSLPSVDALLQSDEVMTLVRDFSHDAVTTVAREVLARARSAIKSNGKAPSTEMMIAEIVERADRAWGAWPKGVVNATGVVLHTNLGRAPLSVGVAEAAAASASIYSDLEFYLNSGKRGSRNAHISDLISQTSGAEAGMAVNNNASGVLLTLAAVVGADHGKKEVIVSRGEAVEIGGGFRIPDVMLQSGATLIEVGTTNRTYAADYEAAITPNTGAILKVHPSNFVVEGFTHVPSLADMVAVGNKHGIPVINDLGSGCLVDTRKYGLAQEPQVQESVSDGAALTLFSGDKLLGGPQAGLIAGDQKWVDLVTKHPLARAVRIDKMTLSAIAATLVSYLKDAHEEEIPIWNMISMSESQVATRAEKWRDAIGAGDVTPARSAIGGGSLPGQTLPTTALVIQAGSAGADSFAASLRKSPVAVIARIENNRILLDPRTVLPGQDDAVVEAVKFALEQSDQ